MRATLAVITVLALTGCGAEVAGTAAVVGTAQVQNAEQAQKQLDQVQRDLEAAQQKLQQRMAEENKSADSIGY